ncbi:hypothetical protein PENTCL1PPCAC_12749, partial [Pristionchus entomophagus]
KRKHEEDTIKAHNDAIAYNTHMRELDLTYTENERIAKAETERIRTDFKTDHERIRKMTAAAIRALEDKANQARLANEDYLRELRNQAEHLHRERMETLRSMIGGMIQAMQQRVWTQQVERQWADRLAGLRNAHTPVQTRFVELQYDLDSLTRNSGT